MSLEIDLQCVGVRAVSSTRQITGHSGLNQMICMYVDMGNGNYLVSMDTSDPVQISEDAK